MFLSTLAYVDQIVTSEGKKITISVSVPTHTGYFSALGRIWLADGIQMPVVTEWLQLTGNYFPPKDGKPAEIDVSTMCSIKDSKQRYVDLSTDNIPGATFVVGGLVQHKDQSGFRITFNDYSQTHHETQRTIHVDFQHWLNNANSKRPGPLRTGQPISCSGLLITEDEYRLMNYQKLPTPDAPSNPFSAHRGSPFKNRKNAPITVDQLESTPIDDTRDSSPEPEPMKQAKTKRKPVEPTDVTVNGEPAKKPRGRPKKSSTMDIIPPDTTESLDISQEQPEDSGIECISPDEAET